MLQRIQNSCCRSIYTCGVLNSLYMGLLSHPESRRCGDFNRGKRKSLKVRDVLKKAQEKMKAWQRHRDGGNTHDTGKT